MRLSAYKKLIDSAMELPTALKGYDYFKGIQYNPRESAICNIIKVARLDIEALFSSEFIGLYKYMKGRREE